MSQVSYQDVYIVNVVIRSISGRTTITEEDIGLPKGTLPPQDVASLGSLITVDRQLLRPFHTIRTRTQRFCESKGVRVGFGTVIPANELQATMDELDNFRDEFYAEKSAFLAKFKDTLDDRISNYPDFAPLLKASSPTYDYVDRRMQYEVDVTKVATASGDPHENLLTATLQRSANNISDRLVGEAAAFCQNIYERALQDSQVLCKRNLTPLRSTLLPKVQSFQLLDGRLSVIAKTLRELLDWADSKLEAIPKGDPRELVDGDFRHFCKTFDKLRSVNAMLELMKTQQSSTQLSVVPNRSTLPSPKTTPATPPPSNGLDSPRAVPSRKRINF